MKMKMMMDDGQDLLLLYKYIHLETDKLKFKNKTKNVTRDELRSPKIPKKKICRSTYCTKQFLCNIYLNNLRLLCFSMAFNLTTPWHTYRGVRFNKGNNLFP